MMTTGENVALVVVVSGFMLFGSGYFFRSHRRIRRTGQFVDGTGRTYQGADAARVASAHLGLAVVGLLAAVGIALGALVFPPR